jgi:hypothetical protein
VKRIFFLAAFIFLLAIPAKAQTQIQSGPTNPATCNPAVGQLFFNNSTTPGVMYFCSATNTWSAQSSGGGGGVIYPSSYGVKATANAVFDATFTNTSQIVTSASAKFLTSPAHPAAVGMIVYGTCCGHLGVLNHVGSVVQVPQGTITSVDSDTQIHVSVAATANQSNATLIYGPDDTAGWLAAITAAWGQSGHCNAIQAPSGLTIIQQAMGNTTVCNNAVTNATSNGASILGYGGRLTSLFVATPNFNYSGCTGGSAGAGSIGCLFSAQGIEVSNIGFWGGEISPLSGTHTIAILSGNTDTLFKDVIVAGWFAADTAAIGIDMASNVMVYGVIDGAGRTAVNVGVGQQPIITETYGGDTNNFGLLVSGAATNGQGIMNGWGPVMANGFASANIQTNAVWNSTGERTLCYILGGRAGNNISFQVAGGASLFASQLNTCIGTAGNTNDVGLKVTGNGTKAFLSQVNLVGGGTGGSLVKTADTSFVNLIGGNVIQGTSSGYGPTCSSTGASQTACAVSGTNEQGVITVTAATAGAAANGTITLTFAGTPSINGTNAPRCGMWADNTGANAWNARISMIAGTASNTTNVFNWDNNAATLVTGTYKVGYQCTLN